MIDQYTGYRKPRNNEPPWTHPDDALDPMPAYPDYVEITEGDVGTSYTTYFLPVEGQAFCPNCGSGHRLLRRAGLGEIQKMIAAYNRDHSDWVYRYWERRRAMHPAYGVYCQKRAVSERRAGPKDGGWTIRYRRELDRLAAAEADQEWTKLHHLTFRIPS